MAKASCDEPAGGLDATDDLDDDVGPGDEGGGVVGEQRRVDAGAGSVRSPDGDADELQGRPDPGGEVVVLLGEEAGDLGADDATAQQGDSDGIHGGSVSGAHDCSTDCLALVGRLGLERHSPGPPVCAWWPATSTMTSPSRRTQDRANTSR